ncbi:MAG TPA: pepsin-like aspartyl protease, partial [Candidatus Dojkabacteria bacterium]|nr:pepsin-like aspartyl protease [Candidatus Dojkabacteria bacterium]
NWQTSYAPAKANFKIGEETIYLDRGALAFDLQSDYVAVFSRDRLYSIYDAFRDYGIFCDGTKCKGNIESFPKLYLNIQGNSIEIPPEIYLIPQDEYDKKSGYKYLRFDYYSREDDSLILGTYFMNHYYTVFDATQTKSTISLYVKNSRPSSDSSSSSGSGFPIILIIGAVIITGGIVFFIYKKKQTQYLPTYERSAG